MLPNSIFVAVLKSSKDPSRRQTSAVSCDPALELARRGPCLWSLGDAWRAIGLRTGSASACCCPAARPPAIRRQRIHHSARHLTVECSRLPLQEPPRFGHAPIVGGQPVARPKREAQQVQPPRFVRFASPASPFEFDERRPDPPQQRGGPLAATDPGRHAPSVSSARPAWRCPRGRTCFSINARALVPDRFVEHALRFRPDSDGPRCRSGSSNGRRTANANSATHPPGRTTDRACRSRSVGACRSTDTTSGSLFFRLRRTVRIGGNGVICSRSIGTQLARPDRSIGCWRQTAGTRPDWKPTDRTGARSGPRRVPAPPRPAQDTRPTGSSLSTPM